MAPLTGVITDATLSLPVQNGVCRKAAGGCTNYFMNEVNPGTATGSINSNGDLTLNDSLSYTLDVTAPVIAQCLSTPINMLFQSTAPYNTSTGDVTLVAANYNIPNFGGLPGTGPPAGPNSCGIAQGAINGGGYPDQVAGSTNNNTTLNLQGTGLPIPPPPGKTTTNVLTTSPTSPQLQGTSVTLTDTISSGGSKATAATGNVNFMANGNVLTTVPVSNGGATYTTTTLPSQTNQLTAVYSGDFNYDVSTSPAVPYTIQPLPSVTLNLPTTLELSTPTPTPMSVTVTNPSTSQTWSSNYLQIEITNSGGFKTGDATVAYQDSAGDWCQMPTIFPFYLNVYFSGFATSCGTPPSSFSLAPGASITINLQISLTYDPNEYGLGSSQVFATLYNGDCTVPVTDSSSCTPSNSPFNSNAPTESGAPEAVGTFTMTYGARLPVSISTPNVPTTPVPEGYTIQPEGLVQAASDPYGTIPPGTGTLTYVVDGTTVVGTEVNGADTFYFSTAGLIPGTHTLTVEYPGDPILAPGSYSQTFTVAPPAPGTPFVCQTTYRVPPNAQCVSGGRGHRANSGTERFDRAGQRPRSDAKHRPE